MTALSFVRPEGSSYAMQTKYAAAFITFLEQSRFSAPESHGGRKHFSPLSFPQQNIPESNHKFIRKRVRRQCLLWVFQKASKEEA
jgi:hypothetical protein